LTIASNYCGEKRIIISLTQAQWWPNELKKNKCLLATNPRILLDGPTAIELQLAPLSLLILEAIPWSAVIVWK
jgi:hypothetical protein